MIRRHGMPMTPRVAVAVAAVGIAAAGAAVWPGRWESAVAIGATAVALVVGGDAVASLASIAMAPAVPDPLVAPVRRRPDPLEPTGLRDARRAVDAPCRPDGLPAPVWERLVVAAVLRFADVGIDIDNPATRDTAERTVSPALWHLLRHEPERGGSPAPARTAEVVHRVLDELDALERSPDLRSRP